MAIFGKQEIVFNCELRHLYIQLQKYVFLFVFYQLCASRDEKFCQFFFVKELNVNHIGWRASVKDRYSSVCIKSVHHFDREIGF